MHSTGQLRREILQSLRWTNLSQCARTSAGFLSLHDMRAVLTDPNVRNAQASGTAAGWPVAEGTDYRRMLVGDPSDYRRLGLHLARPTATRPYYLTEDELNDVSTIGRTQRSRRVIRQCTRKIKHGAHFRFRYICGVVTL